MYTITQIRNRVNTLKRKYATELKILKVFPIAEEYSLDWACMAADRLPLPDSGDFIRHLASWGFRFNTYTNLFQYLERCREGGNIPDAEGILASLFPEVPREKLLNLLPYNRPPREDRGWYAAKSRQIVCAAAMVLASMRRLTAPRPSAPSLPTHEDNRSARRRLQRQAQKLSQAPGNGASPLQFPCASPALGNFT
ncbi:MAG: hypothetical protein OXE17_05665 [Chloroflexi bacterium]|nr:hypothetical protein [Chloroflexota bacterium]